ncbi:MAG: class I SAM-dependent methyltransferase [Ignavibacterium sp.]
MDIEFFLDEIRKTKGRVLEIGVGTGRLFTRALKEGADIYGIDISQPMLEVLSGKIESDQLNRISLQNFTSFNYNFSFNLIIAPFRIMMHLEEKEDQLKAINNAYIHLKRNGKFIFDTFVPDLKQLINGINNVTDFEGEYEPGKKIKRIVSTTPLCLKSS